MDGYVAIRVVIVGTVDSHELFCFIVSEVVGPCLHHSFESSPITRGIGLLDTRLMYYTKISSTIEYFHYADTKNAEVGEGKPRQQNPDL